jgi:WS/DGAT/MGAT family acyltransferase
MVNKSHHCLVDGVGSVDIVQTLLDASPDAPAIEPAGADAAAAAAAERGGGVLGAPLALVRSGVRALGAGIGVAERALGAGVHPGRARDAASRARAIAELLVRDEFVAAPASSINCRIGAKRRIAVRRVALEQVKQIKTELGGTVNDVVLAAAAGGLRTLLEGRGDEHPEPGLRAMVPVNIRGAGERLALGNRISSLFVHLPVAIEDPRERYRAQIAEAEGLKSGTQAGASADLISLTGLAPPLVHSFLARSLYATRLFNLTITNVPGPQFPLYSFGSRLEQIWPLVPLAADHAIGLAVFSYDGELFLCLNADRDSCEDLELLADATVASIDELSTLARAAGG